MTMTSVRAAALAGVVVATLGLPAQASHHGPAGSACCDGAAGSSAACCAPAVRTITVNEWVPETYEATRTVYRPECVTEKYTAYRTECVTETRTRQVTCNRYVTEYVDKPFTTWTCVPTCETRTVCKTVWVCKPVTTVKRRCVDQGHYECREVPAHPLLGRLRHKNDCCDPCAPCCPPTKTVKVWVPCKVWIEEPCTRMERCRETRYETCQVTVIKKVCTTEVRKVAVCKCVPECKTETYCVQVPRQVAFEATRTVTKCVPVVEKYTACRMVCRTVQKQVCDDCCSICCTPACRHSLMSRFGGGGHHRRGCCD
jgi:hypothetical protein